MMARIETTGKVSGELWRVHEADKEIICFMLKNEPVWFRIEYDKEIMPGRADHMAEMLNLAAQEGNGIEVVLEYESTAGKESPLFRNVKYIQVRAELTSDPAPQKREESRFQAVSGFGSAAARRG